MSHAPPFFPICLSVCCLFSGAVRQGVYTRAQHSLWELVLSLYLVGSGVRTEVVRLGSLPSPCCMDILIYKVHISTVKVYLCIL